MFRGVNAYFTGREFAKNVKRTNSIGSADHNVIMAAGESSQIDFLAFIEAQKQMLHEFKSSKASLPTTRDARMSNDERTDGCIKMNFSDDQHISAFSTGDLKNPPTCTGQPGLSNVGGRSDHGFVSIEKEDYDELMQKGGKGRSATILGVFWGRKIWFLDLNIVSSFFSARHFVDQGSLKPSVVWRNTVACLHSEQENINAFLPFSLMNLRFVIDAH